METQVKPIVPPASPGSWSGRRKIIAWASISAVFVIFGLVDGLNSVAAATSNGDNPYVRVSGILLWHLISWTLWIPLVPVVRWVGQRFRPDPRWHRSALAYFVAGVLISSLHAFILILISFVTLYGLRTLPAFLTYKPFVLVSEFVVGCVVFGTILAVSIAWDYYINYRDGQLRAATLETQLAQAQMQALRMQLHPHFLFNTLNSISALQLEDIPSAQKMMARLGDFLRMTLDQEVAQEIPLKQELEFLECYLAIEKTRFGDRLQTQIKIDSDLLDQQVPAMVLQPLVENAIKHGVNAQIQRGEIDVTATRVNGHLQLEVRDNGRGMKLDELGHCNFVEGVGLSNTRLRLQRLYGEQGRLSFHNSTNGGVKVTISIPCREK
jgi:two-component system, LytTR family, sensor kinase